ncbi:MAG: hypothetical protein ABTD50_07670 [Polyangiaceae bacterium]
MVNGPSGAVNDWMTAIVDRGRRRARRVRHSDECVSPLEGLPQMDLILGVHGHADGAVL